MKPKFAETNMWGAIYDKQIIIKEYLPMFEKWQIGKFFIFYQIMIEIQITERNQLDILRELYQMNERLVQVQRISHFMHQREKTIFRIILDFHNDEIV